MSEKKTPSHHGVGEKSKKDYPNETLSLLCERASCRNFSDKEIPEDVLNFIFEAGVHAPTGGNLQPYSIIKIKDRKKKDKLAKLCQQNFIGKAPLDLLFCIDWHRLKRWAELGVAPFTATSSFRHFWISFQDTVISAQNVCTAADAMGLGSVYIGTVVDLIPEVRKMFDLPQGVFPVVLLCIGYPATRALPRKKLDAKAIVHDEKYNDISDDELLHFYDEKYSGVKIDINKERMEIIKQVCEETQGEKFAEKCLNKIKETGYISPVQRYFGLHYIANLMPEGNESFLKIMEESGFKWFKKYKKFSKKQNKRL
jgi:nitroreductase